MGSIDFPEASKILLTGAVSAIFTGILAFGVQSLIKRWLSRSLEEFKINLQLAAFEHQTRFTKLHEKRAKAIAEFYKRLVQAQYWTESMGSIIADKDGMSVQERTERAAKESNALEMHFAENRLYFDEKTCVKIEDLLKILAGIFSDFQAATFDPKTYRDRWETSQKTMHIDFPEIRHALEREFRAILGYAGDTELGQRP